MSKIILPGVISGIIILVWGFLSWMILPFHNDSIRPFPASDAEMAPIIKKMEALGDGMYHFPGMLDEDATEEELDAFMKRYEEGPVLTQVNFRSKGGSMMPPMNFVMGFLTNAFGAMILAWMIGQTTLTSFGKRWLFVFAAGVFATLATQVENAMWWKLSCDFVLPGMMDILVAWAICGIVIAKLGPTSAK